MNELLKNVQIRRMAEGDLRVILDIESKNNHPLWGYAQFLEVIAAKDSAWVVMLEKRLVGYIVARVTLEVCEVLLIGVDEQFKRHGLGRALLEHVLLDSQEAFLEVRQSNAAAIALYEGLGFIKVGVRKKYYSDGQEDAIVMHWKAVLEKS